MKKKYKILLTGGGTMGSVSPLLAIAEEIKKQNEIEFLWIGTKNGPEKKVIENYKIPFKAICSGKLRRYFDWQNFIDIFKIKIGFWQSFFILLKWRPDIAISAGSFVSVPVIWAAWFLRVKILIHQQDIRAGLANKLMAPFAKVITVTFENSLADYGKKAIWTGNPVRKLTSQFLIDDLNKKYNLQKNLPAVLVIGGGTGAMDINKLVEQSLSELTKFCQIIHAAGKNKTTLNDKPQIANYFKFEFLDADQIAEIYTLTDIAISRCGLGILSELSYIGKPVILIPLPDSHQEENAKIFKHAAIILEQKNLTAEKFVNELKNLINNKELQKTLSQNIKQVMKQGANETIAKIIKNIIIKGTVPKKYP
ncbi:MAG: undecaprenyldiphospho-muramoylpentapeptide beta-N-acetylglucosaminyltransferase [Patescibacteria group bacterium]